jgi:hypothetical protein
MNSMFGDPRLSEIRQVTLNYVGGSPASYLIHKSEVDAFVEASKRLHFYPGKNPHNGEEAAKVWQITVAKMEMRGPYWWTVPDLQNNGDPAGAHIIDGAVGRPVFTDEATVARWEAERAESEAAYYREREREAKSRSIASAE